MELLGVVRWDATLCAHKLLSHHSAGDLLGCYVVVVGLVVALPADAKAELIEQLLESIIWRKILVASESAFGSRRRRRFNSINHLIHSN